MLSIYAPVAAAATAQEAQPAKAALQQRLAEVKQSIAQNQAQFKQYAWTETAEVGLKGEEVKRSQAAYMSRAHLF